MGRASTKIAPRMVVQQTLLSRKGYKMQIIERVKKRTGGAVILTPSATFDALKRLHAEGVIEPCSGKQRGIGKGGPRHWYRLTETGRAHAIDEGRKLAALFGVALTISDRQRAKAEKDREGARRKAVKKAKAKLKPTPKVPQIHGLTYDSLDEAEKELREPLKLGRCTRGAHFGKTILPQVWTGADIARSRRCPSCRGTLRAMKRERYGGAVQLNVKGER